MKKLEDRLFLSPPHMSEEGLEKKYVAEAFDTNWVAPVGPNIDSFEAEFSKYLGENVYSAALTSGTAALHLGLILLGVQRGDKVFCSSFTFAASVTPAVHLGAEPVFIDSDFASWNMDPELLEEELDRANKKNQLPKAVIAVDLYGQSADYDRISTICNKYEIPLVQDAAESLGATYKNRKTATFGEMAICSFNGNKIMTASGGGMFVSKNEEYVKKVKFLSTQAKDPYPYYHHTEIGYNYRMSNVCAGIGRGQLAVLPPRVQKRREIFDYYYQNLNQYEGIEFMPEADYGVGNRWLTCLTFDKNAFGVDCEEVRLYLEALNIESRPLWKPLHLQPIFENCRYAGGAVSEKLFYNGLCLPSGTAMTREQQDLVIEAVVSLKK